MEGVLFCSNFISIVFFLRPTYYVLRSNPMTFHIVTLFPDAFGSYLSESILKRAIEDKKKKIKINDTKEF